MPDIVNRSFDFRFNNPLTPIKRYLVSKRVPFDVQEGEIRYIRRDGLYAWRIGKHLRVDTRLLAQMLDTKPEHARGVLAMLFPDYNYFESREGIEEIRAGQYLCVSFEPTLPKLSCVVCAHCGFDADADERYCGFDGCGRRIERDTVDDGKAPVWCPINA